MFLLNLSCITTKYTTLSRSYSSQFSTKFNQCFMDSCFHLDSPLLDFDADQHLSLLNSTWLDVSNVTAPLKPYKPKRKSVLWQNADNRLLRQACRTAERKWKKDKLQISSQLFKDCLSAYQRAAKSAKATYFSNLILKNHSRPTVLFSIIDSVVNPPINTDASDGLCEGFLRFVNDKIYNLRPNVSSSHIEPPISWLHPASWDLFDTISLQVLKDTITILKPTFCSNDIIHPRFFKLIVDSIGPGLVSFLNKCLSTGSVPDHLKVATVTPLLKKPFQYTIFSQSRFYHSSLRFWNKLCLSNFNPF